MVTTDAVVAGLVMMYVFGLSAGEARNPCKLSMAESSSARDCDVFRIGSSEDIRVILWPQGLLVPVEMLGEMPSSRV
jgi:hypothetical protein